MGYIRLHRTELHWVAGTQSGQGATGAAPDARRISARASPRPGPTPAAPRPRPGRAPAAPRPGRAPAPPKLWLRRAAPTPRPAWGSRAVGAAWSRLARCTASPRWTPRWTPCWARPSASKAASLGASTSSASGPGARPRSGGGRARGRPSLCTGVAPPAPSASVPPLVPAQQPRSTTAVIHSLSMPHFQRGLRVLELLHLALSSA